MTAGWKWKYCNSTRKKTAQKLEEPATDFWLKTRICKFFQHLEYLQKIPETDSFSMWKSRSRRSWSTFHIIKKRFRFQHNWWRSRVINAKRTFLSSSSFSCEILATSLNHSAMITTIIRTLRVILISLHQQTRKELWVTVFEVELISDVYNTQSCDSFTSEYSFFCASGELILLTT